VGDYTIQPENGGLGVFAHEYGHDLGLPDLYDTAGNTCGSACENSTGFWTLMSSGSWLDTGEDTIGDMPGDLGVWEKFQLGWLDKYEVVRAGQTAKVSLGPSSYNTRWDQALFVVLPDKEVTETIGTPYEGSNMWWSGSGNDLDNTMTRSVDVPAGSPVLSMRLDYEIEADWDYAYVSVSTDGGANWTNLAGNVTTNTNPNGQNFGNGITGDSNGWVEATFDMSAYAGQTVMLQIRYWTDGAAVERGLLVDAVSLNGFFDGAEGGSPGWTFDGFATTTGTETNAYFNAYVVEWKKYDGYNTSLATGPYNFGFLNTLPNWVEHFPYQDGVLVSYWDDSQSDNSTSAHPGEGLILPVDAHPQPLLNPNGVPWRARLQSYDSTFGTQATDPVTFHLNGVPSHHPSLPAVPVFNDLLSYWHPDTPTASVITPNTGTSIRVQAFHFAQNFVQLRVFPSP
jgi:immune inhibitor A